MQPVHRTCEECGCESEPGNRVGRTSGLCRYCRELYPEDAVRRRNYVRRLQARRKAA